MKIKLLFLGLLALALSHPVGAQLEEVASVEGITEYKMDNGLKVLLFPDNSAQKMNWRD